jgi:Uma2 family endonuclease
MTVSAQQPRPHGELAEPTWAVAHLFPAQGTWSEGEYLDLNGNRLVEFSNGMLEVLTTPTQAHQSIVLYLCQVLSAFASAHALGKVLPAPMRVRLWEGKFREPDVLFMRRENSARRHEMFWDGADLVMEIVSDDDRRRDLEIKRFEYARAGIPEYWIIDPQQKTATVLVLDGDRYVVHLESGVGGVVESALLKGFSVDVGAAFLVAEEG